MINLIAYQGKISKQGVEMRFSPNGDPVTNFTVGVSHGKTKDGEWRPTTWIRTTCWGRLAESVNGNFAEGDRVVVQGSFGTREWEKDGVVQKSLEVTAVSVEKVAAVAYTEN